MLAIRNSNSLPNLVDEFFNEWPFNNRNWATVSSPSVNIIEGKVDYRIDVAAPGLNKEDFKVSIDNNLLTISVNKEVKREENELRYTLCEFGYSSFSRSFRLPQLVENEKISASHKNGILSITVPKREEAKIKPLREIAVM
jgi:HSP20 family protein